MFKFVTSHVANYRMKYLSSEVYRWHVEAINIQVSNISVKLE